MKRFVLFLTSCVALFSMAPAEALSLDESHLRMQETHPLLKACAFNPHILRLQRAQESRWQNPQLNLIGEDLLGSAASSGQNYLQWTLELSQQIPLGSQSQSLQKLGETEAQQAQWECRLLEQNLRLSLQQQYVQAMYWQEFVRLNQEQMLLLKEMKASVEILIDQGKRARIELVLANNELSQGRLKLNQAQSQQDQSRRALAAFWGQQNLPSESRLQWPRVFRQNNASPEIKLAELEKQKHQNKQAYLEARRWADLSWGSGLRWHPESQDLGVNLSLGWQIPSWDLQEQALKATQYQQEQADFVLLQEQRKWQQQQLQLQLQWTQMQGALSLYEQELLPSGRYYLDKVREGMQAGKFTLLQLIEAHRELYRLQSEYLKLRETVAVLSQEMALRGIEPQASE